MIGTIPVPLTAEMPGEALLDATLVLARKVNAHIRALFILPSPDAALANISDVILAAGVTRKVIERETQETPWHWSWREFVSEQPAPPPENDSWAPPQHYTNVNIDRALKPQFGIADHQPEIGLSEGTQLHAPAA